MSSLLLTAQQISRRYATRTVLDTVDLRVDAGSRIGLVGPNGAGKSTLLRILADREPPDDGIVRRFGTVGYLPQYRNRGPAMTVRETDPRSGGGGVRVATSTHGRPTRPRATSRRSTRTRSRSTAG